MKSHASSHSKPYIVVLGVALTLLAAVVLVAAVKSNGWDFRSKASGAGCMKIRATACPVGYAQSAGVETSTGKRSPNERRSQTISCCKVTTAKYTPTPASCTPRPACLDTDPPCRIKKVPGSPPFCPRTTGCPKDAKQCPDGTVLQRTGPNCEFTSCPKPIQVTPTRTSEVNPQAIHMYYCMTMEKRCVKTSSLYDHVKDCVGNVRAYITDPNTDTCYTSLDACQSACK